MPIRTLFRLYLELGNVRRVKEEADRLGLKTKLRALKNDRQSGGGSFTRGHLYRLLSNLVYVGEVTHKGEHYDGAHDAIIDRETWEAGQAQLKSNASDRRNATNAKSPSLLTGLLQDKNGNRLTPSHACKQSKRYRYYISAPDEDGKPGAAWRLPAGEIESVVMDGLAGFLNDPSQLANAVSMAVASPAALRVFFQKTELLAKEVAEGSAPDKKKFLQKLVRRITIKQGRVQITVKADYLTHLAGEPGTNADEDQDVIIDIPVSFRRRAYGEKLIIPASGASANKPDHQLIRAVALGHTWFREMCDGSSVSLSELAGRDKVERTDAGRFLRMAFLAPDIIEAIFQGRQPRDLTFRWMKRLTDLPLSWEKQRQVLGFAS